ncbi:MAG TPA: CHAT domain-containing protein [Chryseosolibacter sp.]
MKGLRIILIAITGSMAFLHCHAQRSFHVARYYRETRRTNAISEPERAIAKIESMLSALPKSKRNLVTRMRFILSFRLADLYVRTGEYQKAENLLLSLTDEVSAKRPRPSRSTLNFAGTMYDCFEKLGYFYLKTGNLRKAEAVFTESQEIRNAVFPRLSVHRIHPLVGFGSLYFLKGEEEKTYATFHEAEQLLERATSTMYDYDNLSRIYLSDLSEICLLRGRNEEAWDYINRLSIASSGIGKFGSRIGRNLETARIMELKARYYLLEGNYPRAQEYLDRAFGYYSSKIGSSDVKFKLLKTQALLNWYQGDLVKSNEAFLSLIRSYRQHIAQNFVAMSEYEKEQFYNTLKSDFNLFNAYALSNYTSAGAHALFEEMYNNALNTKALLLNETNKIKNSIMQSNDRDLINKLRQWEEAKSQLSTAYFGENAPGRIDSLEKKIETLEKDINGRSNLFAGNQDPPDWTRVKAVLKKGEAAVEIIRINTANKKIRNNYGRNSGLSDSTVYLALVVKPDSETPEYVLMRDGNELEKRFLPYYRNSIISRSDDNISYDKFWAPLKAQLKGVTNVYLSPDGVFNQINLNTLRNPVTDRYLIDETEVRYLTNTADLLKPPAQASGTTHPAVLFGRPAYDMEAVVSAENQTAAITYGTRNVLTDELADFRDQEFEDLPGTETEINAIERALDERNMNVQTFTGAEASEENAKAVHGPAIFHIATHGFFVEDAASVVNPMIRSGLVMAGVRGRAKAGTEDGILTAYEATNLDLKNTSLVVLSACDTGLGEIRNGEGVYGLQRAIIVAGASNLLMSLWKVDDEATALLMGEFYKNWDGKDNQSVFRTAQMALRQKYSDPYYWGAFIMVGK